MLKNKPKFHVLHGVVLCAAWYHVIHLNQGLDSMVFVRALFAKFSLTPTTKRWPIALRGKLWKPQNETEGEIRIVDLVKSNVTSKTSRVLVSCFVSAKPVGNTSHYWQACCFCLRLCCKLTTEGVINTNRVSVTEGLGHLFQASMA